MKIIKFIPNARLIILLIILSLAVTLIGCRSGSQNNGTKIKIGAIASLTGAAGEQGTNWVNGATLAVEEAKAQGTDVSLIIEDDQTQPSKVVSSFTKLAQANKVQAILGGTWDFLAEAAFPLAQRYQIPFITPTNPIEVLSQNAKESGFVYSNAITLAATGNSVRKFLVMHQQAASLALVFPDLPFGTRQADMVRAIAKDLNIPVVFEYAFPPESLMSDTVKLATQKILAHKPSVTFMVIDYNGLDLFTKECETLKIDPTVITTQHLDQAILFSKDIKRYKNIYGIYPLEAKDLKFKERFQQRFGQPPKVYAQEGYAATQLLIGMLKDRPYFEGSSLSVETILGLYTIPNDQRLLGLGETQIMTARQGIFEPLQIVE